MFEPKIRNLSVGDGQVAITATQVAAGVGDVARRMNIVFANTGTQEETLIVTLARNGGTQRRVKKVILLPDEQLEIAGYPMNSTDILYAQTTTASVVDYVVSIAAQDTPQTMNVYDDQGRQKTAPYIQEQMDSVFSDV